MKMIGEMLGKKREHMEIMRHTAKWWKEASQRVWPIN